VRSPQAARRIPADSGPVAPGPSGDIPSAALASPWAYPSPSPLGTEHGLTVVVPYQGARRALVTCLVALEQQTTSIRQIIVVDNSPDGMADAVRSRFPTIDVVRVAGDQLVPHLWAAGILRSRAAVVALTTAHMLPGPAWAHEMLQAHAGSDCVGVGGPIFPAPRLGLVDQAIFWLRYNRYAGEGQRGPVQDIAGDNASYRRSALLAHGERIRDQGFWEPEIHALLRAEGGQLAFAPAASARYQGKESYFLFARQRLFHGRRFGAQRLLARRGPLRLVTVAAWPLTPFAFFARIARNTCLAGGGTSLARMWPLLLGLLACWSSGELLGYVIGAMPTGNSARPPRFLAAAFQRRR
jgi:hypothetical protein